MDLPCIQCGIPRAVSSAYPYRIRQAATRKCPKCVGADWHKKAVALALERPDRVAVPRGARAKIAGDVTCPVCKIPRKVLRNGKADWARAQTRPCASCAMRSHSNPMIRPRTADDPLRTGDRFDLECPGCGEDRTLTYRGDAKVQEQLNAHCRKCVRTAAREGIVTRTGVDDALVVRIIRGELKANARDRGISKATRWAAIRELRKIYSARETASRLGLSLKTIDRATAKRGTAT